MEEKQRKIWEEFMQEGARFFMQEETLEQFQARMEKLGFSLAYDPPGSEMSDSKFVAAVIGHLNKMAGTCFRTTLTTANARLILVRRKEKYLLEDFITVINKKVAAWKGTTFETALTPETLFSRKHFDNYLGQKATAPVEPVKGLFDNFHESVARAKGDL